MQNPYWPLFELRIRTPRLEIRYPDDDDLIAVASLIAKGIHDPATMPFLHAWTDQSSPVLERESLRWGWGVRAAWTPDDWTFNGSVVVDGEVVGVQSLMATNFATLRVAKTGSWLGLAHQGQGIGTEMRAAILQLAFEGLGAIVALSGGWLDNAPSLSVSRKFGYRENGRRWELRRGSPSEMLDLRLDRADWTPRSDIEIEGLEACRHFFDANYAGRD